MIARVLLLVALAGCVRDSNIACGDLLCPSTAICVADHICATPAQVERCEGIADGDACSGEGAAGICVASLCQPLGCGDGVKVGDEQCDDGNQLSGDGCSADCRSLETCGNGIVDPLKGERCDDGNLASRDGCTSTCEVEVALWSPLALGVPDARISPPIVYDSRRRRIVMFGGSVGAHALADTWELANDTWRRIDTISAPPARLGYAAAYDAARGVTVLVGGGTDDTWTWDGAVWTQLAPAQRPPITTDPVVAYDSADREVVLVRRGTQGGGSETYTWDGITWTDRPAAGHPQLGPHLLAEDAPLGVLVGLVSSAATAIYREHQWSTVQTSAGGGLVQATLASFGPDGVVILNANGTGYTRWTGTQWSTVTTSGLTVDNNMTGAYDAEHDRIIAFGGGFGGMPFAARTVELARAIPHYGDLTSPVPARAAETRIVADPITQGLSWFLVSAAGTGDPPNWSFDGTWTELLAPGASPTDAAITATPTGAFGFGTGTLYQETWQGSQWTPVPTDPHPSVRADASLAYDSARDRVVLVGGQNADRDGTWEWDGAAWHVMPITGDWPTGLRGVALAYDPVHAVTVAFGGALVTADVTKRYDDTYTYDGAAWTKLDLPVHPSKRAFAAMTWDPARQRIILDGGSDGTDFDDTWEWDGAAWTLLDVTTTAPARSKHTIAYDAVRAQLVIAGGSVPGEGYALRFSAAGHPADICIATDTDGDGTAGCLDPDCAPRCIACGDGACDPLLETPALCPADCVE